MKLGFSSSGLSLQMLRYLSSHALMVSLISDGGKQWIKKPVLFYFETISCSNFIWFPHIKAHICICTYFSVRASTEPNSTKG